MALLLILAMATPIIPVYANPQDPAQIAITIADGMATWDAVEGAIGHNVEFSNRFGINTLFFIEPEVDLAEALARIGLSTVTEFFTMHVRARGADMRVLAEGSAVFRLTDDGSFEGSTSALVVWQTDDDTISMQMPVFIADDMVLVCSGHLNDLTGLGLGVYYPGSWEPDFGPVVTTINNDSFNWNNWWTLFPVGEPAALMLEVGYVSIWHVADTFGMDFSFDADEMTIKLVGELDFSWTRLEITIEDNVARWSVPERVGNVTHQVDVRMGLQWRFFWPDQGELDLDYVLNSFSDNQDLGLMLLLVEPSVTESGPRAAVGMIGLRLNEHGQFVEAPLFDRIVGLRSQYIADDPRFDGDTLFWPAFIEDGRILVSNRALETLMNVYAQPNHQTFETLFRRFDADYNLIEERTLMVGEMAEGMEVPLKLAAGELWLPIRFIAETFGYTVNFIVEEFVIEILP